MKMLFGFLVLLLIAGAISVKADTPPPPPPPDAVQSETSEPPPPPPDEAVKPTPESNQPEKHSFTPQLHEHSTPLEIHQPESHSTPAKSEASDENGDSIESHKGFFQIFSAPENRFLVNALMIGLMVSASLAYLGVYIVLKRVVFVGLALAEVSSAGVAAGLALGFNPIIGSIAFMALGVVLFSVRWSPRRVPQDAFIGIGFAFASAAALLMVAMSPIGESHILDLLKGDILTVSLWDVKATALGLSLVAIVLVLFSKELLFTSFDPETALSMGYNTRLWEIVLFACVGLTIALGIHATGVLFTSGVLVIPATTALLLSRKFKRCELIAVLLALVPVPLGLYLSYVKDLPPSATIVASSFALLVLFSCISKISALTKGV